MASASRETSVAVTRAPLTSCARLTAMLPQPVPMSATLGASSAEAAQQLQRFFDDELGFRPRNEDRRRHREVEPPELTDADDVGGRLAADAARDPFREPSARVQVGGGADRSVSSRTRSQPRIVHANSGTSTAASAGAMPADDELHSSRSKLLVKRGHYASTCVACFSFSAL